MYDYKKAMIEDIKEAINESIEDGDITINDIMYDNTLFDRLYKEYFTLDGITGNASGSYTFNSKKAKEYVCDNMDLLSKIFNYFDTPAETTGKSILSENWESMDVTIRCCLLDRCLSDVLEEMAGTYIEELDSLIDSMTDDQREVFDCMMTDFDALAECNHNNIELAKETLNATPETIREYMDTYC